MNGKALNQPATHRVPPEEEARTCRPAIVRQTRTEEPTDEKKPGNPDWNIIRGED
ncbi:hypothetical protein [Streptomyces sp. NPDC047014]|uniref:hypothetical protein n=1 Tax=Streptomyces sp. NPDC047014 TaxID=3155736 RepID=UPI0033E4B677